MTERAGSSPAPATNKIMVNRHDVEILFKRGDLVVGLSREESMHKDRHQKNVEGKVFEIISIGSYFETDHMVRVRPLSSLDESNDHNWFQGRFKKL